MKLEPIDVLEVVDTPLEVMDALVVVLAVWLSVDEPV